ncbi:MAG: DUF4340 domain-containing protein [Desulfobacteraceae bacterium]|nr:DUF4340 domain-containing protein [Desulfobacteraceae bacterium]
MKVKKEYVLLVLIILALSIYLYVRSTDRTLYEIPEVPDLAGDDITEIDISRPGGATISLNKKDDQWVIQPQGFVADTDKVKAMVNHIKKITLTALVSEAKDYNRYKLGDDQKITVKARTGDKLSRDFDVGKTAPSYQHTFIKLADDANVYHARGNFRSDFDQTVESLRDKTVLSFDKKEITEIRISKGQETLILDRKEVSVEPEPTQKAEKEKKPAAKKETVWVNPAGKKGDASKVSSLLKALSDLECKRYIGNRKKDDLKDPVYRVRLKGLQEYTLSIFAKKNKDAKSYPAVSSQNDDPFELADYQANKIMIAPDEMLEKPKKPKN